MLNIKKYNPNRKYDKNLKLLKYLISINIILRIGAVFLIWWNLLIGFIVNTFLDCIDGDVLARAGIPRTKYQRLDKLLDFWWSSAVFIYFLSKFPIDTNWLILFSAYTIRTVGVIAFITTNKESFLLIFPNAFGLLFFLYSFFPKIFIISSPNIYLLFFVLFTFTLVKEWLIHISKTDITHLFLPFIKAKKW